MALTLRAGAELVALSVLCVALPGCGSVVLDALTTDPESLGHDLVAHWSFDATSGTSVADSSGNGHHGTLTGGTWVSSGRFNGALLLAPGDSVAVEGFPEATASWTVSVWIRTSAAELALSSADFSTIISNEIQYAGGWQINLDNRPNYQRYDAAYWTGATFDAYARVVCDCIEADRWIHLTSVWDGSTEKMTLYRDDRVVDQVEMRSPIQTGNATLYIGKWTQDGRYLAGAIDDFAIWRRALQPPEIAALSQRAAGP